MIINNVQAFDAVIRAACPDMDGVAADGTIFFRATATPTQRAAAATAAAAYADPPPATVIDLEALLAALEHANVIAPGQVRKALPERLPPPLLAPPPAPTPH